MDAGISYKKSTATPEIRAKALTAAEEAFHRVLLEHEVRIDFFARLEQLDQALDECHDHLSASTPSH